VLQQTEAFKVKEENESSQEWSLQSKRYGLLQRRKERTCHDTSKGVEGLNSCKEIVCALLSRKTLI